MPRRVILLGAGVSVGCGAAKYEQQKLKDGSWQVTCQLPMHDCIREAQKLCEAQRFRILQGVSETRLRDAPPFETAYHTSRLHLICTDDGQEGFVSKKRQSPMSLAACRPGDTRACVGPGACKGGQACMPDGSGYGDCRCADDCPVAPVPPAAPESNPPESKGNSPSTQRAQEGEDSGTVAPAATPEPKDQHTTTPPADDNGDGDANDSEPKPAPPPSGPKPNANPYEDPAKR